MPLLIIIVIALTLLPIYLGNKRNNEAWDALKADPGWFSGFMSDRLGYVYKMLYKRLPDGSIMAREAPKKRGDYVGETLYEGTSDGKMLGNSYKKWWPASEEDAA